MIKAGNGVVNDGGVHPMGVDTEEAILEHVLLPVNCGRRDKDVSPVEVPVLKVESPLCRGEGEAHLQEDALRLQHIC